MTNSILLKRCSTCNREKPLEAFNRRGSRPDGLQYTCKACHAERNARPEQVAKRKAKQEAIKADPGLLERERQRAMEKYHRLYANPASRAKNAALARERYRNDPDATMKSRERGRAFRYSPKGQAWLKEYVQRPEVKAMLKASNSAQWYKRYAEEKGAEGYYTARDVLDIFELQDGLCYYCHRELDNTFQVDHYIPITRGGSNWPTNIVAACRPCNQAKFTKFPWEFDPSIPSSQLTPR